MLTSRQVNPLGTQVYMGVLTENADVHGALTQVAKKFGIQTATLELLGGLTEVELSEYDFVSGMRKPSLVFKRGMEIIAGHGTLTKLDDELHVHLHFSLSFRDEHAPQGIAIIGGHVVSAKAFAVEFTLTAYAGAPVTRKLNASTGLKLWDLPTI